MMSSVCSAQEWSRSGKKEIFGVLDLMDAEGEDLDFYGVGLGYNIDDHFNLNTDIVFGSVGDWDLYWWHVNLDYNILEDRLTPVVSGGLGFVFNAWGGEFAYNVGAGGRYDITDNIFVKAMYKFTWISDVDVDGVYIGIGYMF